MSVREVLTHRCAGETGRDPKGTAESLPTHRELETLGRGMHVRPAAGCGALRIGYDGVQAVRVRADGHPQQLAFRGPRTAPDTRPNRARRA